MPITRLQQRKKTFIVNSECSLVGPHFMSGPIPVVCLGESTSQGKEGAEFPRVIQSSALTRSHFVPHMLVFLQYGSLPSGNQLNTLQLISPPGLPNSCNSCRNWSLPSHPNSKSHQRKRRLPQSQAHEGTPVLDGLEIINICKDPNPDKFTIPIKM